MHASHICTPSSSSSLIKTLSQRIVCGTGLCPSDWYDIICTGIYNRLMNELILSKWQRKAASIRFFFETVKSSWWASWRRVHGRWNGRREIHTCESWVVVQLHVAQTAEHHANTGSKFSYVYFEDGFEVLEYSNASDLHKSSTCFIPRYLPCRFLATSESNVMFDLVAINLFINDFYNISWYPSLPHTKNYASHSMCFPALKYLTITLKILIT